MRCPGAGFKALYVNAVSGKVATVVWACLPRRSERKCGGGGGGLVSGRAPQDHGMLATVYRSARGHCLIALSARHGFLTRADTYQHGCRQSCRSGSTDGRGAQRRLNMGWLQWPGGGRPGDDGCCCRLPCMGRRVGASRGLLTLHSVCRASSKSPDVVCPRQPAKKPRWEGGGGRVARLLPA